MTDAFDGVYLVSLDVDEWGWGVPGTGYDAPAVPIFYGVGEDARPNGNVIDGNAWGENIPENMAPPLKEFFSGP